MSRLGADFDGDKGALTALMSDEAIEELEKKLDDPDFYLTIYGKLLYDINVWPLKLVVQHLAAELKHE